MKKKLTFKTWTIGILTFTVIMIIIVLAIVGVAAGINLVTRWLIC